MLVSPLKGRSNSAVSGWLRDRGRERLGGSAGIDPISSRRTLGVQFQARSERLRQ